MHAFLIPMGILLLAIVAIYVIIIYNITYKRYQREKATRRSVTKVGRNIFKYHSGNHCALQLLEYRLLLRNCFLQIGYLLLGVGGGVVKLF